MNAIHTYNNSKPCFYYIECFHEHLWRKCEVLMIGRCETLKGQILSSFFNVLLKVNICWPSSIFDTQICYTVWGLKFRQKGIYWIPVWHHVPSKYFFINFTQFKWQLTTSIIMKTCSLIVNLKPFSLISVKVF